MSSAAEPATARFSVESDATGGASPLAVLRNVSKTFANGVQALAGLDFGIGSGEFVTLLGPSGCGKSTVLRLIAGLAHPTSGEIVWPGSGDRRPQIGFVFQDPTLLPWSDVFSNVWLPLRLKGVARREALPRIEETLRLVGLENFSKALPRELSGGMRMRVSLARALVSRPSLLLMDEPFAALDEITRQRLNDDLLRLRESIRATVLFVTHSVFEGVYLSDRILILAARPGRIVGRVAVDRPHSAAPDFRASEAYARQCRRVSETLQAALAPQDQL